MKVHYVHELYSNNVTKRITMFSSKKKAQDYVDMVVNCAIDYDKWFTREEYVWREDRKTYGVRIIPSSARMQDSVMLFIFSDEVK